MTARFITTQAVILKGRDYSETSRLVTAFAREAGKVRFLAKGARRAKSPFGGLLEPLTRVELILIPGRDGLHTLKECAALGAPAVHDDLDRLSAALFVLALVDETQIDDDPQPEVFDLLVSALERIETTANLPMVLFAVQLRLIELSGYRLDLARCAADEAALGTTAFYSAAHKGLLCRACASGLKVRQISPGVLGLLRRLDEAALNSVERIKLSPAQIDELATLFELVFETLLEKKLAVVALIRRLRAPKA
ncbi:MAG: DNA repair protein RecO [Verrucomicrobia bacterium]|nr:DNA repair protein RecO [Verrucomicrobiota bacterium]